MSGRSLPILNPSNISAELVQAVVVLGSATATETARRAAAKSLHAALLAAKAEASAQELLDTTAELAGYLRTQGRKISNGIAHKSMGEHLLKTGDLSPRNPKKKPGSPSSSTTPSKTQEASRPHPPRPGKRRFGLLTRWMGKGD